jgi:hypothetical protein
MYENVGRTKGMHLGLSLEFYASAKKIGFCHGSGSEFLHESPNQAY